jgi:membrane-associated phospholipid phosphatase
VFDVELVSYLGFQQIGQVMHLRHRNWGAGWAANYRPLATMTRPTPVQFRRLLVFLDRYADLRGDREAEILTQMGGAVTFLSAIPFLHPERTRYTLELIAAVLRLANFVEMRFKQALASRRPNEYSPQVQPIILTPSHSTFPSGHATEAFTAAYVLTALLAASPTVPYNDPSWRLQLMRLASRVAINRTIAGVHFPVDSAAGCFLGLALGQYFVARATGAANYGSFEFHSNLYPLPGGAAIPPLDGDFYWDDIDDRMRGVGGLAPYVIVRPVQPMQPNPILAWLWQQALAEWT